MPKFAGRTERSRYLKGMDFMAETAIYPQMRIGMPGLGENIRNARKNAGLTQEELAERLGVSWMSVHRWEHGLRTIRYCQLSALSDFCDVQISALMVPGLIAEPIAS